MKGKVLSNDFSGTGKLPKGVDPGLVPVDTEKTHIPIPQFELEDSRPKPGMIYERKATED